MASSRNVAVVGLYSMDMDAPAFEDTVGQPRVLVVDDEPDLRGLLLRARPSAWGPPSSRRNLVFEDVEMDLVRHRVYIAGAEVKLRPLEFKLLAALLTNASRMMTRADSLRLVWNLEGGEETRALDATIRRLREKLGERAHIIETIPRVGYRLRRPTP